MGFAVNSMPWMFTAAMLSQPAILDMALQQTLANPFPPSPQGIAGQADNGMAIEYTAAVNEALLAFLAEPATVVASD